MSVGAGIASLGLAAVVGVLVPVVGMRMLGPSLRERAMVPNYRGRLVAPGLGIVWLLWSGATLSVAVVGAVLLPEISSMSGLLGVLGVLALIAFALGLADDVYGSAGSKGFSGHLSALRHGRLTTGMLKLVGISLASLVAAGVVSFVAPWGRGMAEQSLTWAGAALVLCAGACVALTSNFVNLMDLRPGRALKTYVLLALPGAVVAARAIAGAGGPAAYPVWPAVGALVLFAAGPAVTVWRDDLGERGMLGDAGANPAGAVAGLMLVAGMSTPVLIAYGTVMLALNLASERVSFSRVIERTRPLAWLDQLGRHGDDRGNAVDRPISGEGGAGGTSARGEGG